METLSTTDPCKAKVGSRNAKLQQGSAHDVSGASEAEQNRKLCVAAAPIGRGHRRQCRALTHPSLEGRAAGVHKRVLKDQPHDRQRSLKSRAARAPVPVPVVLITRSCMIPNVPFHQRMQLPSTKSHT